MGLLDLSSCWKHCLVPFPCASCSAVQVCSVLFSLVPLPVCDPMAAQAWLNSGIDATAAAGAEARDAQPGFASDRGVTAVADAEARAVCQ